MSPETRVHEEIVELLPWYANDTLNGEERRRVETHVATCATCQREVEILRQVATALQEEAPTPRADLYPRTVARLQPRGMAGLVHSLRQLVAPLPTYARVALVAQLAVTIVLAGALISRGPFTTLSNGSGRTGPAVQLQVIFSDEATTGQIQELLIPLKARIVDGPTSVRVYQIEIPLGPEGFVKTADEALHKLRGSSLIEFVEVVEERR